MLLRRQSGDNSRERQSASNAIEHLVAGHATDRATSTVPFARDHLATGSIFRPGEYDCGVVRPAHPSRRDKPFIHPITFFRFHHDR